MVYVHPIDNIYPHFLLYNWQGVVLEDVNDIKYHLVTTDTDKWNVVSEHLAQLWSCFGDINKYFLMGVYFTYTGRYSSPFVQNCCSSYAGGSTGGGSSSESALGCWHIGDTGI